MTVETKDKETTTETEDDTQETKDTTEESGTADESNKDSNDSKESSAKKEKVFNQNQVNRMMTREKNQGKAAAFRELGIDPNDSKTISMFQSILKATKGSDENANASNENDEKLAEAEHRAMVAEAKVEAMKMNVQPQYVDDIVTLAMNKMKSEDGSDISTILGEFKSKYSAWFEKSSDEDDTSKAGKKGTGSSVNSKTGNQKKDTESLGKRLAAQRMNQNSNKKSFWK
jgi:hypothetical protein